LPLVGLVEALVGAKAGALVCRGVAVHCGQTDHRGGLFAGEAVAQVLQQGVTGFQQVGLQGVGDIVPGGKRAVGAVLGGGIQGNGVGQVKQTPQPFGKTGVRGRGGFRVQAGEQLNQPAAGGAGLRGCLRPMHTVVHGDCRYCKNGLVGGRSKALPVPIGMDRRASRPF
jgi:hypothetical protein